MTYVKITNDGLMENLVFNIGLITRSYICYFNMK